MKKISQRLKQWLIDNEGASTDESDESLASRTARAYMAKRISLEQLGELAGWKSNEGNLMLTNNDGNPTPEKVFGGGNGGGPNVKRPSERYCEKKYAAKHIKTGLAVKNETGRDVESASERELAQIGVYTKWLASKSGISGLAIELTEHERHMVDELLSSDTKWVGEIGGVHSKDISGARVKTLLSDSTSGGLNVNPYFFSDNLLTFPLLNGELLPYVELIDMPRGSEVRSASLGNPTVNWGPAENTSITEFDTAGLVGNIDYNVEPMTFACEIGRDLLADSAVADLGGRVLQEVGQVQLKELDYVIAVGNGTTQPQGIFNAPIIALNTANGVGGPFVVSDIESLMFGLPKQYRTPAMRVAYISNDATYARARGVPVGPNDSRRVFGMDEGGYNVLTWPWRINQSIPDNQLAFGALSRYRMYRRQGSETRFVDNGLTLALKNTVALVVRSRWAGGVVDPTAFVHYNDAPTVG